MYAPGSDEDPRVKAMAQDIHRMTSEPHPEDLEWPMILFNRYIKAYSKVPAILPLILILAFASQDIIRISAAYSEWKKGLLIGINGPQPIPPISDLNQVSGTIYKPIKIPFERQAFLRRRSILRPGRDEGTLIGRMLTDNGDLFQFSCLPGGDYLKCIHPVGGDDTYLEGHHLIIKYYNIAGWLYPQYTVRKEESAGLLQMPPQPGAVIMEVVDNTNGDDKLLVSYEESTKRILAYMDTSSRFKVEPSDFIFFFIAILLTPPFLYRLFTPREQ